MPISLFHSHLCRHLREEKLRCNDVRRYFKEYRLLGHRALCFQRHQDSSDNSLSEPSAAVNCFPSQINLIPSFHSFASISSKKAIIPLIPFRYSLTTSFSASGHVEKP